MVGANAEVRVGVIPGLGAKVDSLAHLPADREWLLAPAGTLPGRHEYGSAFTGTVLAGRIRACGPAAVGMAKRLLREGQDAPLAAGLQLEQAVGAVLYGTDDAREGIAAFVEKRKPQFNGH